MSKPDLSLIRQRSLDKRSQLRQSERFLIDPIFPCGAIHIITGPGSVGKTTWLWQMLYEWEHGRPVFGYKSNPCPWVYIGMDRSQMDADRTLRRLGHHDWDAPVYPIEDVIPRSTAGFIELEPTIQHVVDKFPDIGLYVIEGLQGFISNTSRGQSQNKAEQLWAMRLRDQVLNKGKTIIATTHSPKATELKSNREAMLGSQALIGASGTIIQFSLPDGEKGVVQTDDRIVSVMGKDFPNIYCHYTLGDHGQFVLKEQKTGNDRGTGATPVAEPDNPEKSKLMDEWLAVYPVGTEVTFKQLEKMAESIEMPRSSLYNWINKQMAIGKLLKEGRGIYRRSATN